MLVGDFVGRTVVLIVASCWICYHRADCLRELTLPEGKKRTKGSHASRWGRDVTGERRGKGVRWLSGVIVILLYSGTDWYYNTTYCTII